VNARSMKPGPLPERPVIAVVGAGAVGGYYGLRLARAGFEVRFLLRGDYEAVVSNGWRVRSVAGDFDMPPGSTRVFRDPSAIGRADLVVVTLKATANEDLGRLVGPLVGEGTAILTLQNGLGSEETLAEQFGAERVMGGLAFVCINRTAPGVIEHLSHGLVKLGDFVGGDTPRARQVSGWFRAAGIECEVLKSVAEGRWEKLVWNIPFNGLGALLDAPTDRLVGCDAGLRLVRGLMDEVVRIAASAGVSLPPDLPEFHIRRTVKMGAYQTSMQIDRRMGRPLEIEAILGRPLKIAQINSIDAPLLGMLYDLLSIVNIGKDIRVP